MSNTTQQTIKIAIEELKAVCEGYNLMSTDKEVVFTNLKLIEDIVNNILK